MALTKQPFISKELQEITMVVNDFNVDDLSKTVDEFVRLAKDVMRQLLDERAENARLREEIARLKEDRTSRDMQFDGLPKRTG